MRLYFIRHAQSENNLLWDTNRSSQGRNADPPLTPLGIEQADRLAKYLRESRKEFPKDWQDRSKTGYGITHIYTSLMRRALQTASAISRELDLAMNGREDLHECGGIYLDDGETGERIGLPGPTFRELNNQFPDLILPEKGADEGWWNRPYEIREERFPRARSMIQSMIDTHGATDDNVAIVTHGAFHNALLTVLLKLPEDHNNWINMNNAAITSVDIWEDGVGINYVNRTEFLPSEMIS
ncbi:MAG: histidine phosphatase family protein [Anaerolineaceae bacterium]|nr:histidine phosphatase family protein [Anaerolineaceae bacterium]